MSLGDHIYRNRVLVSSVLLCCILYVINTHKPCFFYHEDGRHKEFGFGSKDKTIIPLWYGAILIAIFCYMFVITASRGSMML